MSEMTDQRDWKDTLSESQLACIEILPESVQYYYLATSQADPAKTGYHDFILDYYKDTWTEEKKGRFNRVYEGNLNTNSVSAVPSVYGVDDETRKRIAELQEIEKLAAEYEGREHVDLYEVPGLYTKVMDDIVEQARADSSYAATKDALSDLAQFRYDGEQYNVAQSEFEISKEKAQNEEILSLQAVRNKEDLVRGAMLCCSYGSHLRQLNLNTDHAVYIRENPQIHGLDASPGKRGDTVFNVGWFGHCSSPTDPPKDTIRLDPYAAVDGETGNYRSEPQDSSSDKPECDINLISRDWEQTDERVYVSANNDRARIGFGANYQVATTQSYLLCKRGGIITPITSGQMEFSIYVPAYSTCPFQMERDNEDSKFMKWCKENHACPYWPGTDEYDSWYEDMLREVKNNGGDGWREEADALYSGWLTGDIQSGAFSNAASIQKIENGNVVRDLYYEGNNEVPSIIDEINAAKPQHGSLENPIYSK